jgi:hypothetical protein
VHFFEAVQKRLDPGHVASPEARIYAADDIIAKFVRAGAPMQINISSAMRSRILRQKDLAAEDLFREASREAMNIMQTVSFRRPSSNPSHDSRGSITYVRSWIEELVDRGPTNFSCQTRKVSTLLDYVNPLCGKSFGRMSESASLI